jgi:acylphosphatase
MRKCIKIKVIGKVQDEGYKTLVQKTAQTLGIEGTLQNLEANSVMIHACGISDNLEKFIDTLYRGVGKNDVQDLSTEPFVNERDYRGVFRIIGD